MTSTLADRCPACGEDGVLPDDNFCEACGARLADDYADDPCTTEHVPPDHAEEDGGGVAAVTDRGYAHRTNEDAFFVAALPGGRCVAVVCDGVSASTTPHIAARVASVAAGGALLGALTDLAAAPLKVMTTALDAAQGAVAAVVAPATDELGPPACTIVVATWDGEAVTVGSAGTVRAYWISDAGAELLTTDNSWAAEHVAAGLLSSHQAAADRRAHAITRWLGSDAPEGQHQVERFVPDRDGLVVLCSDGLWNYAPQADELAELIGRAGASPSPLILAQSLTDATLEAGGHDNVTVAVLAVRTEE